MAHDVFISCSSRDKPTADAVCATLEARGIRCWIAPRDIMPGVEWGEAVIHAIQKSKVMVMVFSRCANESRHIRREVERAVSRGIAIVPFRIEDIMPTSALELFIANVHWLDALTPPLEQRLEDLATQVIALQSKARGRAGADDTGRLLRVPERKPGPALAPRPTVAAPPAAAPGPNAAGGVLRFCT